MARRTIALAVASLAAGALCLWTETVAARGGHFGGGMGFGGGMRFGGGHFGGPRFGGAPFGGMRFGGAHFGGPRFGGAPFGGMRFPGGHFGAGPRFGGAPFGSMRFPGGRFGGGPRFGGAPFGGTRFGGMPSRAPRGFGSAGGGSHLANRPFSRPLGSMSPGGRPFSGGAANANRMAIGSGVRAAAAGAAAGGLLHGQAAGSGSRPFHAFNAQGLRPFHQGGFRHNAFASKVALHNWAFKRHGCCIWFGKVFWPFVAGDVFTAVLWPAPWYEPFWGYGDDYLLSSVLWVGAGGGEPTYSSTNLSDIYGSGRLGSVASSGGSRPPSKPAAQEQADAELAQACGDLAPGVTDLPINDIERTVLPSGDQRGALDALKAAWSKAMTIIKASCSADLPLTPVRRLDLVEERLNAVIEGLQFVSGPLESFYSSLSDGQKRSFDSMTMAARDRGDRSDRGSGASGRLASLCSDRAASFSQLPIDRIEQIIRPSEPQRHALEALQAASARASDELKASCPQTTPQSLLDRLRAVEQRLFAMTTALKSVRPALTEFYGLLSDEQKARFNMMGQTQNEGNSVRANRQVGAR
jgi:hypothetical protein